MGSSVPGRAPSAVLFATVPAQDGGAAAALPADGRTLLERLLAQLEGVGVRRAWVVTRAEWAATLEASATAGLDVTFVHSADVAEDLQALADIAGQVDGQLLLGAADLMLHQRPLAVMLADPRIRSGVLMTTARGRAGQAFRIRSAKGRIVGADTAYHRLHKPTGYQLGFTVIDPADLEALRSATSRMAAIASDRPESWDAELERKIGVWRVTAARVAAAREEEARLAAEAELGGGGTASERQAVADEHASAQDLATAAGFATDAGGPLSDTDTVGTEAGVIGEDGAPVVLAPEDEARVAWRATIATSDPLPLVVAALVRTGVQLRPGYLRAFFYARPVNREGAEHAVERLAERDEDKLALASAVKASDGFFTTYFVSPYSRYIARFCARRGWTPNQMTTVSMAIGVLSALAFAEGSRAGQIAGAILLQAAFTVDCVDGQLARYSLQFSKLGAWLDSMFDRSKEYVVYAGLAVGATRGFDQDVWTLAAAAITLQTFRHMLGFAFDGSRHEKLQALPLLPLEDPGDRPGDPAPAALGASGAAPAARPGAAAGAVALAPAPAAAATAPTGEVVEDVEAPPKPKPPLAMRPIHAVGRLDRYKPLRWARRIWLLPIGERFALISITAALFTPRTTFIALLVWGGATAIWGVTGRVLRSVGS